MCALCLCLQRRLAAQKKESPRALEVRKDKKRDRTEERTGVWRAGETATVQVDMDVKDYGTCSQRGVDQDPPPSYYLSHRKLHGTGGAMPEGGRPHWPRGWKK